MEKRMTFIVLLICIGVSVKSQSIMPSFDVNVKFGPPYCNYITDTIFIRPEQNTTLDGFRLKIAGIDFEVGISKSNQIVYYSTSDSNFLINNFNYLTKNKNVIDSLKKLPITYDLRIGAFLDLPQGWKLGFYYYDLVYINKELNLKENAVPLYLFKTNKKYR